MDVQHHHATKMYTVSSLKHLKNYRPLSGEEKLLLATHLFVTHSEILVPPVQDVDVHV